MQQVLDYLAGRLRSFGYAFRGIALLFRTQKNAQIHLLAVFVITALGLWLGLDRIEWCLLAVCMGQVLAAEGVNTAVEFLADRISTEHHPLLGKAKDVAAGAVLLSVIFCGIVWALIHVPKLWALLAG